MGTWWVKFWQHCHWWGSLYTHYSSSKVLFLPPAIQESSSGSFLTHQIKFHVSASWSYYRNTYNIWIDAGITHLEVWAGHTLGQLSEKRFHHFNKFRRFNHIQKLLELIKEHHLLWAMSLWPVLQEGHHYLAITNLRWSNISYSLSYSDVCILLWVLLIKLFVHFQKMKFGNSCSDIQMHGRLTGHWS